MTDFDLVKLVSDGGAFFAFVFLLVYVLRENSRREDRLMATMEKYAERLEGLANAITEMANTLCDLKDFTMLHARPIGVNKSCDHN